jgi:hypothetical protein
MTTATIDPTANGHQGARAPVDVGPGGSYPKKLSISLLRKDEKTQRTLNARQCKLLLEAEGGFNELLCGHLDVAVNQEEPGTYWILDGQHRVEMASLSGLTEIWVNVYPPMTEQERGGFRRGKNRRVISDGVQEWPARRAAGEPAVLAIQALIDAWGFVVGKNAHDWGKGKITSLRAMERVLLYGGEEYGLARLRLIGSLWFASTPGAGVAQEMPSWFVSGMDAFLWAYAEHKLFDEQRLRETLGRITLDTLHDEATQEGREDGKDMVSGSPAKAKYFSQSLLDAYNRGDSRRREVKNRMDENGVRLRVSRSGRYRNILPASFEV